MKKSQGSISLTVASRGQRLSTDFMKPKGPSPNAGEFTPTNRGNSPYKLPTLGDGLRVGRGEFEYLKKHTKPLPPLNTGSARRKTFRIEAE